MVFYQLLECLLLIFLLSTYFPTIHAQIENTTQPEVTISQGILRGISLTTRNGRDISAFLGVPYAQPPIGNLRFARPVAANSWNGIRNASADSSMCPQSIPNIAQIGEEDCLYLNVYTPQIPQTTNSLPLPVMVYIHGGAYKLGSKISSRYGPEYLLDENVLLVVPNYRLGPLGFLSTGDEVASGNWGLKDQVLALQWVKYNIRYFGGDPDQVTLFGESAGSASVHLLTLSNATEGLFHRYITQSGSAFATWGHRPRAAYSRLAFEVGTYVGCSNDTSDALISCLRTVHFEDIIATQSQFFVWHNLPQAIWGPTDEPDIEGAVLTDSPANLFAAGRFRDLPWISGIVRDEGTLMTGEFHQNGELFQEFLDNFDYILPIMLGWTYLPDSGAAWLNATKSFYFNNDLTTNTSELLSNLTILAGDAQFVYPAHKSVQQHHAQARTPQYFYTFNYRGTFSYSFLYTGTTDDHGVAHADDLIYLFPTTSFAPDPNATMSETDFEMVDIMVQLWTSFAINGTPTASVLNNTISWEPYSMDDNYLRIGDDSDTALRMQYSFHEERMRFWSSIDDSLEEENTTVQETTTVQENTTVEDNTTVEENTTIDENTTEDENTTVDESTTVEENTTVQENTTVDDSGTVILSPNFLLLLLIPCAKFVLSDLF